MMMAKFHSSKMGKLESLTLCPLKNSKSTIALLKGVGRGQGEAGGSGKGLGLGGGGGGLR